MNRTCRNVKILWNVDEIRLFFFKYTNMLFILYTNELNLIAGKRCLAPKIPSWSRVGHFPIIKASLQIRVH